MKKIVNDPENVVSEMLEGFLAAYRRDYEPVPGVNGILYRGRRRGKITLVVGGGSGHEPLFGGFVGRGLADAAACGNIFASPDPGTICEVAKAAHGGEGVLFVYGNYAGDNLNFDMAEEFLQEEGIKTAHVRVWDDCASAPPERMEDRRGIAGDVFLIKIAGAACDSGASLEEVLAVTRRAMEQTRSIGIATAPGQIPGAEQPTFSLGEGEIEFGMGLHGEPGVRRDVMRPADELTDVMMDYLFADLPLSAGDRVCVLVNSLGSTTLLELGVVYRRVARRLEDRGVSIYDGDLNGFCTCQEMGGFSISLLKLTQELKALYDHPCRSPYYSKEGV